MEALFFTVLIIKFLVLLCLFQVKHFLADYPLQNSYMLGKFNKKGWVLPLTSHALVHMLFTVVILNLFCGWLSIGAIAGLSLFDFIIHFTMDRIKASPSMLGRFDAINKLEFKYYQEKIKRAADEEALYNCWTAEKEFESRLKENKYFWWALGVDQMVHHLTHYVIIFIALFLYILTAA